MGLDSVPDGIRAGESWVVRLTILQPGRTPLEGVEPEVTISKPGTTRTFAAPTGHPGVYRASVVFPSAGSWRYVDRPARRGASRGRGSLRDRDHHR